MGFDQRTSTNRRLRAGLLSAVLMLGACGSGSSGFDGNASSEVDAILVATTDLVCVDFKQTTYCGSGAMFPINGDTGAVSFDDDAAPLPCSQQPGDPGCRTSVGFTPDGFSGATAYLAAWSDSIQGPWILSNTVDTGVASEPADREVEIDLPDTGAGAPPSPLSVAVLVFIEGAPPDLPAAVDELRQFGADVIYVTSELDVQATPGGTALD